MPKCMQWIYMHAISKLFFEDLLKTHKSPMGEYNSCVDWWFIDPDDKTIDQNNEEFKKEHWAELQEKRS